MERCEKCNRNFTLEFQNMYKIVGDELDWNRVEGASSHHIHMKWAVQTTASTEFRWMPVE